MIAYWWDQHIGRPVKPGLLSDTGYVVEKDGVPVVASWLYYGNSKLAFMGFPVSSPESSVKDRVMGLILLVRRFKIIADKLGFTYMFGMSSTPAYSKILRKEKFDDYEEHEVFLYTCPSATVFGKEGFRGFGDLG